MMRIFRHTVMTLLILCPVLPAGASADIAPYPLTGGKAIVKYDSVSTDVRMVAEDVLVRISADSISTTAVFVMRNEGETVDMQVGFPFAYADDLVAFRAFVDGRPVAVRDTTQENVGRKKSTVFWKVWMLTFRSGEICTVRVEYLARPLLYKTLLLRKEHFASLPADALDDMRLASTLGRAEYYLGSGRDWKGTLDSCTVVFELADLTGDHLKEHWPREGMIDGNRVVWEYADYEPASFVGIEYCPYIPVGEVPGLMRRFVDRFPDDAPLANSIADMLRGRFHRKDMEREIYHTVLSRWDGPIPQLMEYASGGRCRFNYKAEDHFYTRWRMAHLLFEDYCREGLLDRARDIAPNVSRMTGALVDSLDTCYLSDRDANLQRKARELLILSNGLIEESR
jgi:hypothetical protein